LCFFCSAFGEVPDSIHLIQTLSVTDPSLALSQDTSKSVSLDLKASSSHISVTIPQYPFHADSAAPVVRSVLYLGGGEASPWFFLGVLYALRDYRVPVDSVVGASWGAWVGALWTAGWSLDAIQRLMTDPAIVPYLTEDRLFPALSSVPDFYLPVAQQGPPAMQARFSLQSDTAGYVNLVSRSPDPDTAAIRYTFFQLRIQESLQRERAGKKIPFSVATCDKPVSNTPNDIFETLPIQGNTHSGDYCAIVPVPEITPPMLAIVPTPFPIRAGPPSSNSWRETIVNAALKRLQNIPASVVIIRPHSLSGLNTPKAWMQAGYKAVEARLGDFTPLVSRLHDYPPENDSLVSRFRYFPSFDSISAEFYSHISTYWPEKDTGIVAPQKFLDNISQSPLYDSVAMSLESNGDLMISANVAPVLDFRVGGFGSNILGPNAFGAASFRYVNQFEYLFGAEAFVGEKSYGVKPEIHFSGLWQGNWNFFFAGDFSRREPLRGYFHDLDSSLRVDSEKRSDFSTGLNYVLDSIGIISFKVTLGESIFETVNSSEYGTLKTRSLFPLLGFIQQSAVFIPWFGTSGHRIDAQVGFRSVNLAVNGTTDAPLYLTSTVEAQQFFSPWNALSLGAGVAGGINTRREEGLGYEYPSAFPLTTDSEEVAITNWYRLHMNPTPWSTEWPFTELSSHHYALVRASLGLHRGIVGAWLFAAYMRDFEENPSVNLGPNRLVLEPTLRLAYKSIEVRCGMNRLVDFDSVSDLRDIRDYQYFFKVGN
jgi:NTE family protein